MADAYMMMMCVHVRAKNVHYLVSYVVGPVNVLVDVTLLPTAARPDPEGNEILSSGK